MEPGREFLENCLPKRFESEISEFGTIEPSDVYSEEEVKNMQNQKTSFKAEIRTNFTCDAEAKEWVSEFGQKSGCSFSVQSTRPKATKYSLSKGARSHILLN